MSLTTWFVSAGIVVGVLLAVSYGLDYAPTKRLWRNLNWAIGDFLIFTGSHLSGEPVDEWTFEPWGEEEH